LQQNNAGDMSCNMTYETDQGFIYTV